MDTPWKTTFEFGATTVQIIQGDILDPGVRVDAVVSSDDNHLTMASGIARALAKAAGDEYVREARAMAPVPAGTIVYTGAYKLASTGLGAQHVLHGTVIDYDTDRDLVDIVRQATANCLALAEERGLESLILPAFATGAGGLSMRACAQQMCGAIKGYLAWPRRLRAIYLLLKSPGDDDERQKNRSFLEEANLVLEVPYDPAERVLQTRDCFGRAAELQRLEAIIAGGAGARRHALIAGGRGVGKSTLLAQLFARARNAAQPPDRRVAWVAFGRVHKNTPTPLIYHKLLLALHGTEGEAQARDAIRSAYADTTMGCGEFLAFLDQHPDRYARVVFLIDDLPKLLAMVDEGFWNDLRKLGERVQLIFTAFSGGSYATLRDKLSHTFGDELDEMLLGCVADDERDGWIADMFARYLGRRPNAAELRFAAQEAGRHPYLLSLVGAILIARLKRGATRQSAAPKIEQPRRAFFERLLRDPVLSEPEKDVLEDLAVATDIEVDMVALLGAEDSLGAESRLDELLRQRNPRTVLDLDLLRQLAERGYLADAADRKTVRFMARSFERWVQEYFAVGDRRNDQPRDVVIGLLNPEPDVISTLFGRRGARLVAARKRLPREIRDQFLRNFRICINHLLHQARYPDSGPFAELEQVANFILTYFATDEIKAYLQRPPPDATILLTVDDALKDIPWELMLEFADPAGEHPFKVGRSIVSQQPPHNIKPPVRGESAIKALLIGDPLGDLSDSRAEVEDLCRRLRADKRFEVEDEDVWIGPERCTSLALLSALGSGRYGLIHYSGHSKFDDYQSAWLLKDGRITTDLLTSALQNAPPVLVFSSSCESGASGELQPARYENQTFDLPSAFLQAGVEAYVGTLWEVDSNAAGLFVEAFYDAFLSDEDGMTMGECLRRAKRSIGEERNRNNRLAFILYGDPHAAPDELFPVLAPTPAS